jgi:hypothetical protein
LGSNAMPSALSPRLRSWLPDNPDETILRWIFRSILAVTVLALAADLADLNGWAGSPDAVSPSEVRQDPPAPDSPAASPSILAPLLTRLMPLPQPDHSLAQPITFELAGGGRLMATGTITLGSAQAFAAEIDRHGEYIKTVVLNSPGGSVTDALAIGQMIRARQFATEVEAGKSCASSCPLVFAGGITRRAGAHAVIGVHQIAAMRSMTGAQPRDEMSLAQAISARCQRYLAKMDVNLQVWVHAMETPHDKLFVFKPDELRTLNLTTPTPELAPEKART